jgi:DNA-binding response OmpR family regulator
VFVEHEKKAPFDFLQNSFFTLHHMKILVVEDEAQLLEAISESLASQGWHPVLAATAFSAEEKLIDEGFDIVVLDVGLPDGSGLNLLDIIAKQESKPAVVIVSARDSLHDKLEGLKQGADDYITKPFYMAELNARIRAIQRRRLGGEAVVQVGALKVYSETRRVLVKENELNLTPREYDILMIFLANQNRVLSKTALAEYVWGKDASWQCSPEMLYTHIKNLRRKIISAGGPNCIQSVYGIGYKLEVS